MLHSQALLCRTCRYASLMVSMVGRHQPHLNTSMLHIHPMHLLATPLKPAHRFQSVITSPFLYSPSARCRRRPLSPVHASSADFPINPSDISDAVSDAIPSQLKPISKFEQLVETLTSMFPLWVHPLPCLAAQQSRSISSGHVYRAGSSSQLGSH